MDNEHDSDGKQAIEKFCANVFKDLGKLGRSYGITSRRMIEILQATHVHHLREQGLNQQQIMAETGFSLKTVRKILATEPLSNTDNTDYIGQIVGDWASDPAYPETLPLNGKEFPTFKDLCDQYGKEFTPGGLLKVLQDKGVVEVGNDRVTLVERSLTPIAPESLIEVGAGSVQALLSTLEHNFSLKTPAFVERRVRSERILKSRLPGVRDQARDLISKFRQDLTDLLVEAEGRDEEDVLELIVAGVGVYWYEEGE